eukprot:Pompholyxophrys_punicea_v1_NODE_171_length_3020_cov_3.361092.p1 type:complete len:580 gc:universal NODE_171_length_3020_cov_3.361092:743-2482(+)
MSSSSSSETFSNSICVDLLVACARVLFGSHEKNKDYSWLSWPENAIDESMAFFVCKTPDCGRIFRQACHLSTHEKHCQRQANLYLPTQSEQSESSARPEHVLMESENVETACKPLTEEPNPDLDCPVPEADNFFLENCVTEDMKIAEILPILFPLPTVRVNPSTAVFESATTKLLEQQKMNAYFPFATNVDKQLALFFERNNISNLEMTTLLGHLKDETPNLTLRKAEDISLVYDDAPKVQWFDVNLRKEFPEYEDDIFLRYRPAMELYANLFADPFWSDTLVTSFQEIHKDGKRCFGPLNSGYWWEWNQKSLPKGSALFAYALASDSSQIFKKGRKSFWPLYLIFANSDEHMKTDRAIQLLGHIPILERDCFTGSDERFNLLSLQVWHRAYEIALQSFEKPSTNGINLIDGNQKIFFGYPRLAFCTYDWPEQKVATLTYDSLSTSKPCHICLTPKEDFGLSTKKYPLRTVAHMDFVRDQATMLASERGGAAASKALLSRFSVKPFRGYLSKIAGCNPYLQANIDLLHLMFSNGLLQKLIYFCECHIEALCANSQGTKDMIDLFLSNMPTSDFQIAQMW